MIPLHSKPDISNKRRNFRIALVGALILGILLGSIIASLVFYKAITQARWSRLIETVGSASRAGALLIPEEHTEPPETALEEEIQRLREDIQKLRKDVQEIKFTPLEIPVPVEYQIHLHNLCRRESVDMSTMLNIWYTESRLSIDPPDNYNKNGTIDRGPMQINSVNWGWLADEGLDINDPFQNLEAAVLMYSRLVERYGEYDAARAYNAGVGGMLNGGGYGYAEKVMGGFEL